MNGIYRGELIRDGQIVHRFAQKNRMLKDAGDYTMAALLRNLYTTQLVDYEEYDAFLTYSPPYRAYYLTTIPMDYPSICPTPIGQWYMGLIQADSTLVYREDRMSTSGPWSGGGLPVFTECTAYVDSGSNPQRILWEPDAPVNGSITNSTPTRFSFVNDDAVFGIFLGSSPTFRAGVPASSTTAPAIPGQLLSICSLPFSPVFNTGQTFRPRAGDELRVQYMVYF